MARLGVNIERAALLRNVSKTGEPDPVSLDVLAELGGTDGIVCRLRKDYPSMTERDIRLLREIVKTHLNIQIAPEQELLSVALSIGPDMITLMPEKRAGSTEGGGFDVLGHIPKFEKVIGEIRAQGIVVSIVVDPVFQQVKAAAKAGADYIELQMSRYAEAEDMTEREDQIEAVRSVAIGAAKIGLGISAGTGLDYHNINEIIAIENIKDNSFIGGKVVKISIFLSVFDVHINRIPATGVVDYVKYNPGKFFPAYREKASLYNEQTEIGLTAVSGQKLIVKQIAGIIARRIVCHLKKGEDVTVGKRFGMIKFGSRTELIVPADSKLLVKKGDHVYGGKTAIGYLSGSVNIKELNKNRGSNVEL